MPQQDVLTLLGCVHHDIRIKVCAVHSSQREVTAVRSSHVFSFY